MGQVLQLLSSRDPGDVYIDFENAQPTGAEEAMWTEVSALLNKGPGILNTLQSYEGCADLIRQALSLAGKDGGAEAEQAAWVAVLQRVKEMKEFYDFALQLGTMIPRVLIALSAGGNPKQSLADQQALAKLLADMFDFILRFDELKMICPQLQNDFAYYRRSFSRMKPSKDDPNIVVRDDLANKMSFFFAYASPMMQSCSDATAQYLKQQGQEESVVALSAMANVCLSLVSQKKFSSEQTNMFCLRAMTGAIILYDHVDASGAFHKNSPIKIQKCCTLLKKHTPSPVSLLNALRYSTSHLNDDSTPSSIKNILEV
eukprot:GFYU01001437.1.p1 GENE.GFYU01001437.1~~GFYU01001437.1.p1  ORF type:complete len:315 (-),score=84.95 GFYU01001437.1:252-1196(-)